MIDSPPNTIYYCYGEWQKSFENISNVNFISRFDPEMVAKENLENKGHVLLILDDLMDCIDEKTLLNLYTKYSHHRNISPVLLLQNLYHKGLKNLRDVSLNTMYNIILKSPHDRSSISTLASQMYPRQTKYFLESYEDATKEPYSYLFVDSRPTTPDIVCL